MLPEALISEFYLKLGNSSEPPARKTLKKGKKNKAEQRGPTAESALVYSGITEIKIICGACLQHETGLK